MILIKMDLAEPFLKDLKEGKFIGFPHKPISIKNLVLNVSFLVTHILPASTNPL